MDPENYNLYEIDGILVYLYKEALVIENTVEIKPARYASDLLNKEFDIIGLNVK